MLSPNPLRNRTLGAWTWILSRSASWAWARGARVTPVLLLGVVLMDGIDFAALGRWALLALAFYFGVWLTRVAESRRPHAAVMRSNPLA